MPENETPAVVVGGRYVVGEGPSYRYRGVRYDDISDEVVGMTVTVTSGPDPEGDVLVEAEGELSQWLDPRHLTPAPEPAAASAVDDDLLTTLGRLLDDWEGFYGRGNQAVRDLLASEPMQSLRDAWINTERKAADANWDREVKRIERERDEARATKDLRKERQQELEAALNTAVRERDEARAELELAVATGEQFAIEVERLRQQNESERQHVDWLVEKEEIADRFKAESDRVLGEIGELVDPWMGFDGRITDGVKAVVGEVKRLRAAWTAEAIETQAALRRQAERERDAAQAKLKDHADCAPRDSLRVERDNAIATVERLDAEAEEWKALDVARTTELCNLTRERDEARAELELAVATGEQFAIEVERLRAAQQLPDVGPVERGAMGELVITLDPGERWFWRAEMIDRHEQDALHELAAVKAARAFLDAEAAGAGATTDDEPTEAERHVVGMVLDGYDMRGCYGVVAADVIKALDAHRVRSGQDGAR